MLNSYSTYLLLEDRVDFLRNQYKNDIKNYQMKSHPETIRWSDATWERVVDEAFNLWSSKDPTPNKQYLQWILKIVYKTESFQLNVQNAFEDSERFKNALTLFHNNKQRLPVDKRDINKIRSLHDLEDLVEPFEGKVSNRQQEKLEKQEGAEVYYKDSDWMILKVTKPEAACYYGKNTKWCTSNINTAKKYIKDQGFLLVFIDKKNNKKYQATPDFQQLMDEKDRPVKDPEKENIVKLLLRTGYIKELKNNPGLCYQFAYYAIEGRWEEAEPYIKKSPRWAYYYALDVIRGRWPEAEEYIVKDLEWAYDYARDVIEGRFPEAEEYIMKDPKLAYFYARDVIKGKWPEAEEYIMKDPKLAYFYARDVIKGKWPEAEEYIKTNKGIYRSYLSYLKNRS